MKIKFSLFFLFVSISGSAWSQEQSKTIQGGNVFFNQQLYEKAAAEYNKVLSADPGNITAKYNLAATLYKVDQKEEAAALYVTVATDAKESVLRSNAWYNKGVILTRQKRLEESIETYKNALRQNPDNKEARENLQKALLELKKKNPPEKKEEQQKKKKKESPQKQPQSKMSQKEAAQRLKLLEQKEKEVQQRLQKEKAKAGAGQTKDW